MKQLCDLARLDRLALASLALYCCTAAQAGPPFVTDDPEPVEQHHAEINLALQKTGSDTGQLGTVAADMNFGCARETQCHVAVPLGFSNASGAGMQTGIGDVELGLKYRFLNRPDAGVMAAVYPTLFLPTGSASRGLGNGRAQLLLPLWLQKSAGPWTWDAGVSYLLNSAPQARSNWYFGLLTQRAVSQRVKLGAELFHRTAVAQNASSSSGFNVGAVVKLSPDRNLLVSVGRGIQNLGANRLSLYVAYQLEL